ncbi:ferredoxin [Nocardioides marmotae]|uniref:ferredoxin n=1 Tax=Nocardioides marmotae TaxID=2663857 RepID=UPI0012B5F1E4|nr:ferredoxin [Nocardioides marmotae]MBC9734305.1 ferredoxin [Nocardioides marmotae]MTB85406.1 ferredoxin [Nocardioides marmotae]
MDDPDRRVTVEVDTTTCVGSGTCAMVDPEHFSVVDGKARVVPGELVATEDLEDAVLDCPVQALRLGDA